MSYDEQGLWRSSIGTTSCCRQWRASTPKSRLSTSRCLPPPTRTGPLPLPPPPLPPPLPPFCSSFSFSLFSLAASFLSSSSASVLLLSSKDMPGPEPGTREACQSAVEWCGLCAREGLVLYCRTTSASTAPCMFRRMCCPTHCASMCAPCQPLVQALTMTRVRSQAGDILCGGENTSKATLALICDTRSHKRAFLARAFGRWVSWWFWVWGQGVVTRG